MLVQARYLPFDLQETAQFGRGPSVVLVHGLYASAGVWRPLRDRLARELDASTYSFSYVPGPGICELSGRLRSLLRGVRQEGPVVLIGHSLGGLVVRHCLARADADPRVAQSISLAAPFLGSRRSHLVPGQAGRDITRGAAILGELRRAPLHRRVVPHLSLVGSDDDLIVPSAFPDYGQTETFEGVGHNGMLFDERVLRRCVRVISEIPSARFSR